MRVLSMLLAAVRGSCVPGVMTTKLAPTLRANVQELQVRTYRRMAYIGTILRELQITQQYSNTYACDEAILNMGVQYYGDTPKVP